MIKRDDLTQFIYQTLGPDFLEKAAIIDTLPNSVQIKGTEKIAKLALGVSCSQAFIEQAIQNQAQYLLVHHGLATDRYIKNGRFDLLESRLKLIVKNNLTLAGFHYALDAHPTLGNNAQIIDKLGATRLEEPYFESWGWIGQFSKPVSIKILKEKSASLFNHQIHAILSGPDSVKRIGVCSGGARPHLNELFEILDHHVDLHLTGEISEGDPHSALAGHFNYFAGGHYATETFGVKALGAKIQQHFGKEIVVEFIDIPTDL